MRLFTIVAVFTINSLFFWRGYLNAQEKVSLEPKNKIIHESRWGCLTPLITQDITPLELKKGQPISNTVARTRTKSFVKGDRFLFYALTKGVSGNFSGVYDTVRAELVGVSAKTHIWVALSQIANGNIDTSFVPSALIHSLEIQTPEMSRNPTKGIYDVQNDFFGRVPNYGNSDGIVTLLLFDIRDGGSGIVGYFNPNDQSTREFSNQCDILYLDAVFFKNYDLTVMLAVVAHEFQYLINHTYNFTTIAALINEGLSELAASVCGYGVTHIPHNYLRETNISLFSWLLGSPDYARAGLWHLYLFQQAGDSLAKRLVQSSGNLWTRYDDALAKVGYLKNGIGAWKDFAVANYVQNVTPFQYFGYPDGFHSAALSYFGSYTLPIPATFDIYDPKQESQTILIKPYGLKYVRYLKCDSLSINFSNTSGLEVIAIENTKQVSMVSKGSYTIFPELSAENELCFVLINTTNTDISCSFSSDGKSSAHFDNLIYDSGYSLDDRSLPFKRFQAAVRFSLPVDSVKLRAARLWLLDNSAVEVSVFSNNSGLPGDLLGSLKFFPRTSGYSDIDLDNFNLTFSDDFFIACRTRIETVPGDTSGNTLLFDRTSPHHNRSYYHDGVAWKTIDQLGYGPGDLGIQAVVSSLDRTAPELKLGLLASPFVNVIRVGVGANEAVSQIDLKINSVSKPLTANGDLSFASYTLQNEELLTFSVFAVDQSQNYGMFERSYQVAPLSKTGITVSNYDIFSDQPGFIVWKKSSAEEFPLN